MRKIILSIALICLAGRMVFGIENLNPLNLYQQETKKSKVYRNNSDGTTMLIKIYEDAAFSIYFYENDQQPDDTPLIKGKWEMHKTQKNVLILTSTEGSIFNYSQTANSLIELDNQYKYMIDENNKFIEYNLIN